MTPLRVVFFGSPEFAVPTLRALAASAHPVVGVVSQPDRPRGRGQKVTPGAVAAAAVELGLPLLQPVKLSDAGVRETLERWRADLGVVAAYGKILPPWLLAIPPRGLINVHASLLPAWRGAAPVHRAIMAGDRETGVTIMRVVQALDAGAMLDRVVVPIDDDATSVSLEQALAVAGAARLVDAVDRLAAGPVHEEPQDDTRASYASKITRADSPIDWTASARAIHDRIRGLHPWPHAASTIDGQRLILHRSALPDVTSDGAAGTIVASGASGVDVVAGDGRVVRLLELQAENGRRLPAAGFLAGRPLPAGTRFDTP
ncbi:MAG: methionyl-tRNA formyltransferase [Vicinamibacterales bacterium]